MRARGAQRFRMTDRTTTEIPMEADRQHPGYQARRTKAAGSGDHKGRKPPSG